MLSAKRRARLPTAFTKADRPPDLPKLPDKSSTPLFIKLRSVVPSTQRSKPREVCAFHRGLLFQPASGPAQIKPPFNFPIGSHRSLCRFVTNGKALVNGNRVECMSLILQNKRYDRSEEHTSELQSLRH